MILLGILFSKKQGLTLFGLGGEDPDHQDPLVENIVEGEPHVCHQLLHATHVLLHCQRECRCHQLLWHELWPELGGGHPGEPLVDREQGHHHVTILELLPPGHRPWPHHGVHRVRQVHLRQVHHGGGRGGAS